MSLHTHEITLAAREVEGVEINPNQDLVVVEGPLWVTRVEDNHEGPRNKSGQVHSLD